MSENFVTSTDFPDAHLRIQLQYTGDYPGTPFMRWSSDGRPFTDEETKVVLKMFNANSVEDLFKILKVEKFEKSIEYRPCQARIWIKKEIVL